MNYQLLKITILAIILKEITVNSNLEKSKRFLTYLFYIILVLIWGSSFILMKRGLDFYSPLQVASIRQVSATIVLLGFAVFHIRKIPLNKLSYVALVAMLMMVIPASLFCFAEVGISSAIAGILNALTPAFTLITGTFFFKQSTNRMQLVGLVLGFIGVVFLILINASGELSFNHFSLFAVAACISVGFSINIIRESLADVNPLHIATVSVLFAGIVSLIYLSISGNFNILMFTVQNKNSLLASTTLGVLGTAIAQLLYNQVIRKTSAVFASSVTYVIPVVAVFWGVLDGESLLIWHYVGMSCVIIGVIVMRRSH